MFWITYNIDNPLIETVLYNQSRKSKYPFIIINNFKDIIKYNKKTGIIIRNSKKIIWDDNTCWIQAPGNIEFVDGKFKNIWSLLNIEIYAPIYIYLKDSSTFLDKYIEGTICGFGYEDRCVTIKIGNKYYYNIKPGVLKIKLPKFKE